MQSTNDSVRTTLRIPGDWSHPRELLARLPAGFKLTAESLLLPDGKAIEFVPISPDAHFAEVFKSACRRPATDEELAIVGRYTANVALCGPGGSLDAARTMMQAGAAIVRAGAAGVFIDNSALAHGGEDWIAMADDGSPDALSFAFVCIVSGGPEIGTVGMHVLGFPDLVMRRAEGDAETIVEVVRYVLAGGKAIGDGHVLADGRGLPRFRVATTSGDERTAGSSMHNPFGRLRLTSLKEIVESN